MTIAAPLAMVDLANRIGRALDPDTGGASSFGGVTCGGPASVTHVVCDTLITRAFAAQCGAMLADADLLHHACAADYAARWPDLVAPTPDDCAAFLAHALIWIEPRGRPLDRVLSDHGLALTVPPAPAE